ncbi:hypothetical protein PPTG_22311 [Phytophthora nicotianae INRA-310]|uniref:Uncharacterized protein n=1 Tax=Phytophthora nicotianae (strain INRA-310) TaxID=761204 RepID=W2QKS4_PHYN3|nr:hypothetical protein PPTG_22311 [Phytophthora nicotianae INRA-310]ETN13149.1 hypothetical protein PPTG_22311 [Phytophthora nicotianae INRA-310]
MLGAPDISAPALEFPSCAHVHRKVRYNRWLEGPKDTLKRVRQLIRVKAVSSDLNTETAFAFGNRQTEDGFWFVGNGEDEEPLILGITSVALMQILLVLQEKQPFLFFYLDTTFKLSDIGYPDIISVEFNKCTISEERKRGKWINGRYTDYDLLN